MIKSFTYISIYPLFILEFMTINSTFFSSSSPFYLTTKEVKTLEIITLIFYNLSSIVEKVLKKNAKCPSISTEQNIYVYQYHTKQIDTRNMKKSAIFFRRFV